MERGRKNDQAQERLGKDPNMIIRELSNLSIEEFSSLQEPIRYYLAFFFSFPYYSTFQYVWWSSGPWHTNCKLRQASGPKLSSIDMRKHLTESSQKSFSYESETIPGLVRVTAKKVLPPGSALEVPRCRILDYRQAHCGGIHGNLDILLLLKYNVMTRLRLEFRCLIDG